MGHVSHFSLAVEAEGIDGSQKATGHEKVYDIEAGPAPDGHLVRRNEQRTGEASPKGGPKAGSSSILLWCPHTSKDSLWG